MRDYHPNSLVRRSQVTARAAGARSGALRSASSFQAVNDHHDRHEDDTHDPGEIKPSEASRRSFEIFQCYLLVSTDAHERSSGTTMRRAIHLMAVLLLTAK